MFDSWLFAKHLEEDENVIRIVHKHWLLMIRALFWPVLCLLIGWFFLYAAPTKIVFAVITATSLYCLLWFLRSFFDYYLDVWIITDQGVIDLNWQGWFHRQSTRVLYSDIQGVSYEIAGMFGTLFQYGTLTMEKISTGATVSLSHVHKPKNVEMTILRNMENYLHGKNLKNAKHVQELLAHLVSEKIQLDDVPGNE